jgi:AcrR family transcriptional regulator
MGSERMGRTRSIDRQSVLDAAERVVARDGAARLTLEAVAIEAGIAKASVIYDCKSKNALIKAIIERSVARHSARLGEAVSQQPPGPDRPMRGRLAAAATPAMSDAKRTVALSLVAALAHDPELRLLIGRTYGKQMRDIAEASDAPRRAMLAFLALEGLLLMERFGLYDWPPAERDTLLGEIGGLLHGALPPGENRLQPQADHIA